MARRSNRAVKRLAGSAHGSFTLRAPCSGQLVRGGGACRIVGTGRYPDAARVSPADDRKARSPGRIPGMAKQDLRRASGARAPPLAQLQVDAFHAPRLSDTQNLGLQVSVLHVPIISATH